MSQIISITGNLTADPERRSYTTDGVEKPIAVFTVAVNRRFKRDGQPDADFFPVKVFGPQAQACLDHLRKGRIAEVQGTIEMSRYEPKGVTNAEGQPYSALGIELNASNVTFHGRNEGTEGGPSANGTASQPTAAAASGGDDMPF